jgi:hypothetical protein
MFTTPLMGLFLGLSLALSPASRPRGHWLEVRDSSPPYWEFAGEPERVRPVNYRVWVAEPIRVGDWVLEAPSGNSPFTTTPMRVVAMADLGRTCLCRYRIPGFGRGGVRAFSAANLRRVVSRVRISFDWRSEAGDGGE